MKNLKDRAKKLGLNGVVGNWGAYQKCECEWLEDQIELEEKERDR